MGLKLQNPCAPRFGSTVPDKADVNVTLENVQTAVIHYILSCETSAMWLVMTCNTVHVFYGGMLIDEAHNELWLEILNYEAPRQSAVVRTHSVPE